MKQKSLSGSSQKRIERKVVEENRDHLISLHEQGVRQFIQELTPKYRRGPGPVIARPQVDGTVEQLKTFKRLGPHPLADPDQFLKTLLGRPPTRADFVAAGTVFDPAATLKETYRQAKEEILKGLATENLAPFFAALSRLGPRLLCEPKLNAVVEGWWVTIPDYTVAPAVREAAVRNMEELGKVLQRQGGGNTRKFQEQERKARNRQNNTEAQRRYAIRQYLDACKTKYQESKVQLKSQGKATAFFLRQQINAIIREETTSHVGNQKREAFEQFKQWAEKDIKQTMRKNSQ